MLQLNPSMSETQLDNSRQCITTADSRFFYNEEAQPTGSWCDKQLEFAETFYQNYVSLLKDGYGCVAQAVGPGSSPSRTLLFDARDHVDRRFLWQLSDADKTGRVVQQLSIRPGRMAYMSAEFDHQGRLRDRSRGTHGQMLMLSQTILDFLTRPENIGAIDELMIRKNKAMAEITDTANMSGNTLKSLQNRAERIGFTALKPLLIFGEPEKESSKPEAPIIKELYNPSSGTWNPAVAPVRELVEDPDAEQDYHLWYILGKYEQLPQLEEISREARDRLTVLGKAAMKAYDKAMHDYIAFGRRSPVIAEIHSLIERSGLYADAASAVHTAGSRAVARLWQESQGRPIAIANHIYFPVLGPHGERWLYSTDYGTDKVYFNRYTNGLDAPCDMEGDRFATLDDYASLLYGLRANICKPEAIA